MDNEEFWYRLWKLLAVAVCVLMLTVGGCTANRHYQIRQLVQSGVDPIGAKCAVEGETHTAPICVQRAMQK